MPYLVNKLNFSSPRWSVLSRVLAATLGGYILATASSFFISQLLMTSVGKYQAIHIGLMLTFIVYACVAMWVFSVKTATKAWLGLLKLSISFVVATWLLMQFNGVAS
ncbi:DUF3649 domain-containing protein [Colwellia psychrerythraea]|uniref:DUF3649 domain-containing protein n=1 Tax=Colwellia psychrerythraea TaxID=28229 RepID=A0A099L6A0_COLPS|nr:DUF3649 domain-containing protein [Colwellia psychrerythraea]KGJ97418.1 Protein of unknown function DUF3649 [Colwellia psychrerythraea]